jgi:hypothetical protein
MKQLDGHRLCACFGPNMEEFAWISRTQGARFCKVNGDLMPRNGANLLLHNNL